MDNNDNSCLDSLIEKYNYVEMLHETFDSVITPEFRKRGFRKRGNTFYHKRDGIIEICNVQFSRDNSRINSSFTYNIRIAVPILYDALNIKYNDELDTLIFDERFGDAIWGHVERHPCQYWYRLTMYKDAFKTLACRPDSDGTYDLQTGEGLNTVVVNDIENIIIKFFDSIPNGIQLLNNIANEEPDGYVDESMMLNAARLYYCSGKREEGRKIISRIRNGYFREAIEACIKDSTFIIR